MDKESAEIEKEDFLDIKYCLPIKKCIGIIHSLQVNRNDGAEKYYGPKTNVDYILLFGIILVLHSPLLLLSCWVVKLWKLLSRITHILLILLCKVFTF